MKYKLIFLAFLFFNKLPLWTQEPWFGNKINLSEKDWAIKNEFIQKKQRQTRLNVSSKNKIVFQIPFKLLVNGIIIINIKIDYLKDSLNFIFDTGNSANTLDSITAKHFNFTSIFTDKTFKGISGESPAILSKNHHIYFNDSVVEDVNFYIHDYTLLSSYLGIYINGIIGLEIIKRFVIEIDYDSKMIRFYNYKNFIYPVKCKRLDLSINPLTRIDLPIKDQISKEESIIFDTGAGLELMLDKNFIEKTGFLKPNKKKIKTIGEGLGGKFDMELTTIRQLKIGGYVLHNIPTYIIENPNSIFQYPKTVGLIGNNILKKFNQIIDVTKRQICLIKNDLFYEEFDYNYYGFNLVHFNNKNLITDITSNSPAEQYGLQDLDEVICIGKSCSTNLEDLKLALLNSKKSLKLIIRREGELKEIELKSISILK